MLSSGAYPGLLTDAVNSLGLAALAVIGTIPNILITVINTRITERDLFVMLFIIGFSFLFYFLRLYYHIAFCVVHLLVMC